LSWKQIGVLGTLEDRQIPFYVQWIKNHHPSTDGKAVAKIVKIEITGDESAISEWLGSEVKAAIGNGVEVEWLKPEENEGETGIIDRDRQIAGRHDPITSGCYVALYSCNRDLRAIQQCLEKAHEFGRPGSYETVLPRGTRGSCQVSARAEGVAGTRDNDDAHVRIQPGLFDECAGSGHRIRTEPVAQIWPVQGQRGDSALDGISDRRRTIVRSLIHLQLLCFLDRLRTRLDP
jgi:hypothetical protein